MEQETYCLNCFAAIPASADACSHCGAHIADLHQRTYLERLIHALLHPLAEVRMRAIIVLGLLGEVRSASALVSCALRHPIDVPEGLEIVRSLDRIRDPSVRQRALLRIADEHPARGVRQAARETLKVQGFSAE